MAADRKRARELAGEFVARGRPLAWFEPLYRESLDGSAVVPWADLVPNPFLVRWLDREEASRGNPGGLGQRALDVGCGLGDNAEELARRGYHVTAFDVAPTAVAEARRRFPESRVDYVTADLLAPPARWRNAFDLVAETYTLQVLPPRERKLAAERLRTLVAPGGTLLVIARGREPHEPQGAMPWPLTLDEISAIAAPELVLDGIDDFLDEEDPPVRRIVATFRKRLDERT